MKGQTAVEYLMTYGWAILIILIVAGVLAYYGIFQPQGFLGPTARGFGQLQVLNPWALTTGGAITMNLQNQVGGTVNVTDISATITNGGTGKGTCTLAPGVIISSGSQGVASCTLTGQTMEATGKAYTASVTITYQYGSPASAFTSTGTLSGTIG